MPNGSSLCCGLHCAGTNLNQNPEGWNRHVLNDTEKCGPLNRQELKRNSYACTFEAVSRICFQAFSTWRSVVLVWPMQSRSVNLLSSLVCVRYKSPLWLRVSISC